MAEDINISNVTADDIEQIENKRDEIEAEIKSQLEGVFSVVSLDALDVDASLGMNITKAPFNVDVRIQTTFGSDVNGLETQLHDRVIDLDELAKEMLDDWIAAVV